MDALADYIPPTFYVVLQTSAVDLYLFTFQPGFAGTIDGALFRVVEEQVGVKKLLVLGFVDNHIIS